MTAVEWFAKQVLRSRQLGFISNEKFNELLEQSKEMEKEQKIEFACAVYDKYYFGPQEISFREECEQFKSE